MAKILTGKKALLLAEACKLNKRKKDAEKRIKEIREEIKLSRPGDYTNEAGDTLKIVNSETFTDIEPKKVLTYLKKHKMAGRFWSCVKVQITPLKKVVPESVIGTMRSLLDPTQKWSWK